MLLIRGLFFGIFGSFFYIFYGRRFFVDYGRGGSCLVVQRYGLNFLTLGDLLICQLVSVGTGVARVEAGLYTGPGSIFTSSTNRGGNVGAIRYNGVETSVFYSLVDLRFVNGGDSFVTLVLLNGSVTIIQVAT